MNTRNFGHIRSPFHGLLQARGDAVISIVADLQDPPEMIRDFVAKWEEGYKVVVGVKKESLEKRVDVLRARRCSTGSSTASARSPWSATSPASGSTTGS